MGYLLRLLLIGAVVYAAYRAVRGSLGRATGRALPCATCRNCKALFDDGVICAFGAKETFKNETHIANCSDYRRGTAS
ncbi:MAG: hypothetical protein AAF628_21600 [Planctomycetota bacterium]